MPYSTMTDILDQIEAADLLDLTDDENLGQVSEPRVLKAIADADAEINGYCGKRYRVPFDPVPELIRKFSVDIAIYNIFARRAGAPEDRRNRYKDAIAFLRLVAAGSGTLGEDDPSGNPAPAERPTMTGPGRIFSREKLGGW
ncbi:MAG: gp436 family protein [Desulfomicrobium sp.]